MVYLDYNSTTPIDPRVLDTMNLAYKEHFGNPSSSHSLGIDANNLLNKSRESIANLVNTNPSDVVFTSGATEANNMIISWIASNTTQSRQLLYGATEHKSIVETCKYMSKFGLNATPIPVNRDGIIDMQRYPELLNDLNVNLVSVMAVNSETGVINPIKEIAQLARDNGAIFHCDATQAVGRIPFDMTDLGVDIATMSSHKIHGPKGVGALIASRYIRKQMNPLIHGGGQERNLRSGTENVPGIVGFAKACDIALSEGLKDTERQSDMRDYLERQLISSLDNITVNGGNADRVSNTTNLRIAGALADAVLVNLREIEISTGSACSSATMEPSHVLTAMGLTRDQADESIRISIGRYTTREEIYSAISDIIQAVMYVRGREIGISGSAL